MFRTNNIGVLILNGRSVRYSNYQILTTESSIKLVQYAIAKQQPSNVKHGGAIRPNVWVPTFGPPCICVHFFQMKVHFRIYLIVWIVESSQILLNCVWPFKLRLSWKNKSVSFSDDRDMKLNEVIHYVWSGDWVEARSALWEACRKPNYRIVIGSFLIRFA